MGDLFLRQISSDDRKWWLRETSVAGPSPLLLSLLRYMRSRALVWVGSPAVAGNRAPYFVRSRGVIELVGAPWRPVAAPLASGSSVGKGPGRFARPAHSLALRPSNLAGRGRRSAPGLETSFLGPPARPVF